LVAVSGSASLAIAARAAAAGGDEPGEEDFGDFFPADLAGLFFNPAPMMAPVETWVVRRGSLSRRRGRPGRRW